MSHQRFPVRLCDGSDVVVQSAGDNVVEDFLRCGIVCDDGMRPIGKRERRCCRLNRHRVDRQSCRMSVGSLYNHTRTWASGKNISAITTSPRNPDQAPLAIPVNLLPTQTTTTQTMVLTRASVAPPANATVFANNGTCCRRPRVSHKTRAAADHRH